MTAPKRKEIRLVIPKDIPESYVAAMVVITAQAPIIVAILEKTSNQRLDDLLLRKYSCNDSFLEKYRATKKVIIKYDSITA
ncbi:MAG: hypothetical protein WC010_04405 [Candidatus Absconditabacterales bacterium]